MLTATVDISGLSAKIARAKGANVRATAEAAREATRVFVGWIDEHGPRDTNRYINGFIIAALDVDATDKTPRRVEASQWKKEFTEALEKQIDGHIRRINSIHGVLDAWYHSKGRKPNAWYRKKVSEANTETRKLVKALDTYRRYTASGGKALVFLGADSSLGGAFWRDQRRRASTIRDTVYGGEGRILASGDRADVILHNREPHCTLVETRFRVVGRARAFVAGRLGDRVKRVYMKNLAGR